MTVWQEGAFQFLGSDGDMHHQKTGETFSFEEKKRGKEHQLASTIRQPMTSSCIIMRDSQTNEKALHYRG